MEVPSDERYYLTTLKSLRNELEIPQQGKTITLHLDRDFKKTDVFYEITIDRSFDDKIEFILTRRWDLELGEIDEDVLIMCVYNNSEYEFFFCDNPIAIEELQYDFVIADFFEELDLFDNEVCENNIEKQAIWFLALCGCSPEIYDYIEDKRS